MATVRSSRQLANALREARKQQGLTQTELGEKAGMSQENISRIESGKKQPTTRTVLDLLAALNYQLHVEPRDSSQEPLQFGLRQDDTP